MDNKENTNIPGFIKRLSEFFKDHFTRYIIHSSARLLTINLVGVLILFTSNYFLIKLLGDVVYGQYVTINVWLNFFMVIILFGMDDFFVATIPKHFFNRITRNNSVSIFNWGLRICLIIFIICSLLLGYYFLYKFYNSSVSDNKLLLWILLGELVLLGLLIAFFRGINKILQGQLADKILRPAFFLLGMLLLYFFIGKAHLTNILWLQSFSLFIAIVGLVFLFKKTFKAASSGYVDFDRSGKANLTFLGISILYMLSVKADILIITGFMPAEEVGYYNLAARLADVIGYPLIALNLVLPTIISKEYAQNRARIPSIMKKYVLLGLLITILAVITGLLFGRTILSLFGSRFVHSFWPMIILASTHLFFACTSPINALLMVSGKQRYSLACLFISALATLGLCYFVIPLYGMLGAALSTLAGSFIYLIALLFVFKQQKMN